MLHRRDQIVISGLLVTSILLLVSLTWFNYRFALASPGGNDFFVYWIGAQYWVEKGISPYNEEVNQAASLTIYGRPAQTANGEDKNALAYPLYAMIFFAPFGLLDFNIARAIWMTILEISLVSCAYLSIKLSEWKLSPLGLGILFLFSLFWYNGARTLILGAFSGINALLILGALLLIQRKRDLDAGLLLALSTSKPQMSLLIVAFAFLWGLSVKRTKISLGIVGGLVFLLIGSIVFLPSWPTEWIRQMISYSEYTVNVSIIFAIGNAFPGIKVPLEIALMVLFGGYLLAEWILAWGKSERWFLWTALLTLVITNFVAFRTSTPQYIVLLPVIFLVFHAWQERWGNVGQVTAWINLFVFFGGFWALFLATVAGRNESIIMYLPFPIICLLGLWWVRWWAIRPPRLFYDEFAPGGTV